MYPDVTSVEDCKRKCLESPYRCHSFDFGDGSNKVCRTSHLNQASSVHIQDPYLEVANGATYELDNCYNGEFFSFFSFYDNQYNLYNFLDLF